MIIKDYKRVMDDREEWRERVTDSMLMARHDDDDDFFHLISMIVV